MTVYRINPVSKKYHDIDLSIRGHSRAIRRVVWTSPENLITFDDDSIILWDLSRRTIVAKAESKKHLLLTDAAAQREVLPLLADAVRQLVEASPTCPVVSASSITGR